MERVDLDSLHWNEVGLVPVVVQDVENGGYLLVA